MTKRITIAKHVSRTSPADVPAIIARDLLRLVAIIGDDPEALMRKAGLGHIGASLLGTARAPHALSHDDFTRLYAHCTWLLDWRAARQEEREPLTKAGIDMLCHCIITCVTLRDAMERADLFSIQIGPRLARLLLTVDDGVATLTMPTVRHIRNGSAYLSDLTGLSTYHRLFGWLIGEDITLMGAALRYPPLLDERTVSHLLPGPLVHGAAENSLRFAASYLDRLVIRLPAELDHLLERFPFDLGQAQSKQTPLSERLTHLFAAALASGTTPPTAPALARQFGFSAATVKRRLTAEGTNLARIKATARLALATQLLDDPRLTVTETARRTGFSDTGAFRRAFRHWTGQSPTDWRRRHAPVEPSEAATFQTSNPPATK